MKEKQNKKKIIYEEDSRDFFFSVCLLRFGFARDLDKGSFRIIHRVCAHLKRIKNLSEKKIRICKRRERNHEEINMDEKVEKEEKIVDKFRAYCEE